MFSLYTARIFAVKPAISVGSCFAESGILPFPLIVPLFSNVPPSLASTSRFTVKFPLFISVLPSSSFTPSTVRVAFFSTVIVFPEATSRISTVNFPEFLITVESPPATNPKRLASEETAISPPDNSNLPIVYNPWQSFPITFILPPVMINWPLTYMPYLVFSPSLVPLAVISPPSTRNVPGLSIRIPDAFPSSDFPSHFDALALIVPLSMIKVPLIWIPDPVFLPYAFKVPSPSIVTFAPSLIMSASVPVFFKVVTFNVFVPFNVMTQFDHLPKYKLFTFTLVKVK